MKYLIYHILKQFQLEVALAVVGASRFFFFFFSQKWEEKKKSKASVDPSRNSTSWQGCLGGREPAVPSDVSTLSTLSTPSVTPGTTGCEFCLQCWFWWSCFPSEYHRVQPLAARENIMATCFSWKKKKEKKLCIVQDENQQSAYSHGRFLWKF